VVTRSRSSRSSVSGGSNDSWRTVVAPAAMLEPRPITRPPSRRVAVSSRPGLWVGCASIRPGVGTECKTRVAGDDGLGDPSTPMYRGSCPDPRMHGIAQRVDYLDRTSPPSTRKSSHALTMVPRRRTKNHHTAQRGEFGHVQLTAPHVRARRVRQEIGQIAVPAYSDAVTSIPHRSGRWSSVSRRQGKGVDRQAPPEGADGEEDSTNSTVFP